jgi:hypothetical protein
MNRPEIPSPPSSPSKSMMQLNIAVSAIYDVRLIGEITLKPIVEAVRNFPKASAKR